MTAIGSLIAFGSGVGGLDRVQFRQAFVHAAKLLAMKSIGSGVKRPTQKPLPSSEDEGEATPSKQRPQKGDEDANDQSQFH